MLIGERPLLLVSLGLGGFQNLPATAWWAAESWTPGGAFTPAAAIATNVASDATYLDSVDAL